MTICISGNYALVWQLMDKPQYKFTKSGRCFNTMRGKEVRRIINGRCEGFCICGKFRSLKVLRAQLVRIKEEIILPF
jgi:hypothetical protein